MKTSDLPYPRLPSLNCEDAEDVDSASNNVEDKECTSNVTQEDLEAAQTLLKLHRDGVFAIRRLINRHNGKIGRAVTTLIQHSIQHPLDSAKSAQEVDRDQRARLKKNELSAALTLVKLSGQSRAESKAGLALLCLRRECIVTLALKQQKRIPLARLAIERRNAAERFLALKRFREQYPAVLRTSRRKGCVSVT